jgi:flagellar hook-length control protein FliK
VAVAATDATTAGADASSRPQQDTRAGGLAQLATASPATPVATALATLDAHTGRDGRESAHDTADRAPVPAPKLPSGEVAKAAAAPSKTAPVSATATHIVVRAGATSPTTANLDGARPATAMTSAARPLSTAPAAGTYGVRLEQAAETVRTTIAVAARQDSSSARIQLSPASLGGIQIHLQRTADGLVARVIAEHPEAAQTLAQNGDDLRRSLQQSGMTLLRLDIESSDRRDASAQQHAGPGGSASRTGTGTEEDGTPGAVGDATSTQISVHDLSDGALVNVLA